MPGYYLGNTQLYLSGLPAGEEGRTVTRKGEGRKGRTKKGERKKRRIKREGKGGRLTEMAIPNHQTRTGLRSQGGRTPGRVWLASQRGTMVLRMTSKRKRGREGQILILIVVFNVAGIISYNAHVI